MMNKKTLIAWAIGLVLLAVVNLVSSFAYDRIDLTEDGRFSLSAQAETTVAELNSPVIIDVLLGGDLPVEFQKLRVETQLLLEEFASVNPNIKFSFVDPLAGVEATEATIAQLQSIGLTPARVTVEESNRTSQEFIFPWAMVNQGNKTVKVGLLKNKLGATSEERINNSVRNLEYAFADAFSKLQLTSKKRIAVLKGNGELEDIYIADFLSTIREYYNIGAITLDSIPSDHNQVYNQLKEFDLLLVAKPTETFTDEEKYILDQYIVQGGRSLWLIDQVNIELDSLFNETGTGLALPRDLNLGDMFFRYGFRINPDLVNDLYFTQIVLATGDASDSQYSPVPWYYNPMVFSPENHAINNNLEALRFQFASSIDTLENTYQKTILYSSSPLSKLEGTPRQISLDMVNTPPDRESYSDGNKPMAVLIEGEIGSAFKNRVKPLELPTAMDQGGANKMIVISDGDLIKNQIRNGRPLELGYDKWTNNFFGNKEFLVNCVNFLLDDNGLINIRTKSVHIPLLDAEKIQNEKTRWQAINIGVPLILLLVFGWAYNWLRRRKYAV